VLELRGALREEDCCFDGRIVESFVVWVKPSPDDASIVGLAFVSIATLKGLAFVSIATLKGTLSGVRQSSCMLFQNVQLLLLLTSTMEAFVVEKESNVS